MNDNDVIAIIIGILEAGFTSLSIPNVTVLQNYQPTQQGVIETPAIYLHKIDAPRYGFPGRQHVYNSVDEDFDTTETIWRTPTYQVNALAQQDPSDIASLTASDYVEAAAHILQTEATRQTLLQSNIGITRIRDIRIQYFVNDKDRHEQEPSFDFTLSYRREFISKTPAIVGHRAGINRV